MPAPRLAVLHLAVAQHAPSRGRPATLRAVDVARLLVLSADPAKLQPKLVASLSLDNWGPILSAGSGWVAVWWYPDDVRLFRIEDGLERRLPVVKGKGWGAGQYDGLLISGGRVYLKTCDWDGTNSLGNQPVWILNFPRIFFKGS